MSSSDDDGQASDAFDDDDDELRVKLAARRLLNAETEEAIRRSSLEKPMPTVSSASSSSREAATDDQSRLRPCQLGGTPLDHDEDALSHLMGVMGMRLLMIGAAVSKPWRNAARARLGAWRVLSHERVVGGAKLARPLFGAPLPHGGVVVSENLGARLKVLPRPGSARTEEVIDALAPPPEYVAPNPKSEMSEADKLLRLPPEHAARRLSAPAGIACHGGAIFVVVAASDFDSGERKRVAAARVLRLRECDGALLAASPLVRFARPKGIAVADGKCFVANGAGGRGCIAVFDATTLQPAGTFCGARQEDAASSYLSPRAKAEVRAEGQGGSGFAPLVSPCGLTAHGFELLVCDRGAHRLRVLSFSGEVVRDIGREGRRPGEFKELASCSVAHGRLITAEAAGARVQVLTMAGEPLQVLPMPTANRVPPCLHGLCLGDRERQLWVTDTERNVLHRLAIRVYAE